ncbi:hypothetical protein FRC17_006100 [Serendipita sp. 399]|nr:hypothetical protein FRC17_006100 [Serendipita sp. 399]
MLAAPMGDRTGTLMGRVQRRRAACLHLRARLVLSTAPSGQNKFDDANNYQMAGLIQNVAITGTIDRTSPKPHTVYEISVTTRVRLWKVWHRYSEFDDLHEDLVKACSAPPPVQLPGKHIWSFRSSFHNEALIQERKVGLEKYLQCIIASQDPQWRDNNAFRIFLGLPLLRTDRWMEEYTNLQNLTRNVKASLNKRKSLRDSGDMRDSSLANIQAKRQLADLVYRVGQLAQNLKSLSEAGMSAGELQRRTDMVTQLQDDCEQLYPAVTIAQTPHRQSNPPSTSEDAIPRPSDSHSSLLSIALPSRLFAWAFGAPQPAPNHIADADINTLDNRGLVQLQNQMMKNQDSEMHNLSTVLQRQLHIAQAISDRTSPKPHTVYEISVTTPMRSWQMWRRYSEFDELHDELIKSCSAPPPAELPGKHIWSFKSSFHNEALIEERKAGLEKYLRTIIASKDPQWRDNAAFRQFLGAPVTKYQETQAAKTVQHTPVFSTASWIEEHSELQTLTRNVRASLNKRDSLWDSGDTRASSSANIQAKRQLADLVDRVGNLAQGLKSLSEAGMSAGELQRRTDMVTRLQDDCEQLNRVVAIARNPNRQSNAPPTSADAMAGPSNPRGSLLGGASSRPFARVFGAPQPVAEETAETRPLDDRGLVQLQHQKMKDQDSQLDGLSAILQRQMHIGQAISTEIDEQNKILDEMSEDVDRVTDKIKKANKTMAKLS